MTLNRAVRIALVPLLLSLVCTAQSTWAAISFVAVSAPSPSSNAVSSVTIARPAGLALDDVMIATITNRGGAGIASAPAGWILIATAGGGQNVTIVAYYKVATDSEPSNYTWNLTSSQRAAGAIQAFRDVSVANPIAASATNYSSASAATLVAPSVTPPVANTMLVAGWAVAHGAPTIASPAPMTERFEVATSSGPLGVVMAAATEPYATTAPTGTRSATSSGSDPYASMMIALWPRPSAEGEWQLDEGGWNGTAGEVQDTSTNAIHGRSFNGANTAGAAPALTGDPGTCRYGNFDGVDDHVEIPHQAVLNGTDVLTYSAWIYPRSWSGVRQVMAKSVHGGGSGPAQMGMFGEGNVLKGRAEAASGRQEISTTLPTVNTWSHVALVWRGTALELYVNGALSSSVGFAATTLVQTTDPLAISKRVGSDQYFFDGYIDEVRVYRAALTAPEVARLMTERHPCPSLGVTHFRLTHANYAIHCASQAMTVTARSALGSTVTNYTGAVTMTTGTGRGSWSLGAGSGAFLDAVADDGVATYGFSTSDAGTATFVLSYPEGASPFDPEVYQTSDPTIRDDDTDGTFTFSPSGFTVTGTALSNPPPSPITAPVATQTAGTNFAVHLTAFGQTPTDPLCGVIESYSGNKTLNLWMTHQNPNSGPVVATIDGTSTGTTEAGATSRVVAFTNGQAQVTAKYKDVGSISLSFKDGAVQPQAILGESNAFVVRPSNMTVTRVETLGGVANPAATTATGPVFVAAGAAFRVEVEVLDAEGTRTPNYGRESTAEGIRIASSSLVLPVGGRNGSSGTGVIVNDTAFTATATLGRFRNDAAAFDEVGIIRLVGSVADGSYLGSGPLVGTSSGNVGRFRVASFDLNAGATLTPACGSLTYMDQQALGVNYVIEARNTLAGRVWNYDTTLLGGAAVAGVVPVAENADAGVDLGSRLNNIVSTWTLGQSSVSTSSGVFARAAGADGPFDGLQIGVRVNDGVDGVLLSARNMRATTTGDCSAAGNCDAVTVGGASVMRYGRLMVKSALGPETSDLAVPLEAQYFDGALFRPHTLDNCSTYRTGLAGLSDYTGNLALGETVLMSPGAATALVGGATDPAQPLLLSAPNIGNDGSVNVTLDVPPHLEFDWTGIGVADPVGTARFGRYRGHDRIIFWRER